MECESPELGLFYIPIWTSLTTQYLVSRRLAVCPSPCVISSNRRSRRQFVVVDHLMNLFSIFVEGIDISLECSTPRLLVSKVVKLLRSLADELSGVMDINSLEVLTHLL